MSEQAIEVAAAASAPGEGEGEGGRTPASLLAKAAVSLRTAYQVVLGEPMKEGRLSFAGLSGAPRAVAAGGLLALVAMLASVVFNDAWRAGDLVDVGTASYPAAVPLALVPVTLVAFFVAWLLILWGAFNSVLLVRVVVAVVFVVLNSVVAHPEVLPVSSSLAIRWAPGVALATYCAVPAVLVLAPASRRWPSVDRYCRPVALAVAALGTALFFGADLWAQTGQMAAGTPLTIPTQLHAALVNVDALLFPMVSVSVLAIVELSYSVTEAASGPFWRLAPWAAKAALAALLAVKLWREVGARSHVWYLFVREREGAVVRTLAGLALLAGLAYVARRYRPRARASEEMRERVVYSSALVLALPVLVSLAVYGSQQFLDTNFPGVAGKVLDLPGNWAGTSSPAFWGAALVGAAVLVWRARRGQSAMREAGIGLAMVAVWAEFFFLPEAFGHEWGFDPALFDAALTVCVAAYAVRTARTMSTHTAVWLGAVVGFSWLVSTQGDLIGLLGRLAGLPGTVLLAAGLGYSLLVDSEFTRGASRNLPAGARPLLWMGYLLLSATITNWVLATHGPRALTLDEETVRAFQFIGLPIAAWFLSWRPFARVEAYEEDEQD